MITVIPAISTICFFPVAIDYKALTQHYLLVTPETPQASLTGRNWFWNGYLWCDLRLDPLVAILRTHICCPSETVPQFALLVVCGMGFGLRPVGCAVLSYFLGPYLLDMFTYFTSHLSWLGMSVCVVRRLLFGEPCDSRSLHPTAYIQPDSFAYILNPLRFSTEMSTI